MQIFAMFIDRIQPHWRRLRWFVREIVAQFTALDLMNSAAALTYMTLFAVVPMMTVGYFFFSLLPDFAEVGDIVREFIFANFVPAMSELIEERLVEFAEQARQLTAIGVVFLGVVAFRMLISIEQAFNRIWNVVEPRRGLQRFLTYWGVLTCGPPLIALGFLITSYLFSLPLIADVDTRGVREQLLGLLPVLLSATGFTILYFAVPNCRIPFRHALLGGILAAIAFDLAQRIFAYSVSLMNTQFIYGAFAAVPLLLAWIYIIWVLILGGAIFVRTLSLERDEDLGAIEPPLIACLRILAMLHSAHMNGDKLTELQVNRAVRMNLCERERVYGVLGDMKLCARTDDDALALGRNLRSVTLWDLYQRLPERMEPGELTGISDFPAVVGPLQSVVADTAQRLNLPLEQLFDDAADGPGENLHALPGVGKR